MTTPLGSQATFGADGKCSQCNRKVLINPKTANAKDLGDILIGHNCDSCCKTICKECSSISPTEIRSVALGKRVTVFFCSDCMLGLLELPKLKEQVKTLTQKLTSLEARIDRRVRTDSFDQVRMDLDKLTKDSNSLRESMKDMEKTIKATATKEIQELRTLIEKPTYAEALSNLEKESKTLKNELSTLKTKVSDPPVPANMQLSSPVELTITEIQEREKRAANLIIFGLEENQNQTLNIEELMANELTKVKDLLKKVNDSIDMENVKIHRLGRFSEEKIRPVKVVFPSRERALDILRHKAKLNGNGNSCYIKNDQTPAQRSYLKHILSKLEERKSSGEEDLTIKYIRGIPSIVKQQKPKNPTSPSIRH